MQSRVILLVICTYVLHLSHVYRQLMRLPRSGSGHNDGHLGRDAGLGAAGAGALGAAEYEHNKSSSTQQFDQGSTTGSSVDNTGPRFSHGHFQSREF